MAWLESKIRKMGWMEIALIKLTALVFGLLIAKLVPSVLQIDYLWMIAAIVVLAIEPVYKAFKK